VLELIDCSLSTLGSIKKTALTSREQFVDPGSGELFYGIVLKDIERVDTLLRGLRNYFRVCTPTRKRDTVHTLIEEVLRKSQPLLEEKKAAIDKRFERGLPEMIVPDEVLRYILISLLRFAVDSMPSDEKIGLLTRSFVLQNGPEGNCPLFNAGTRYIEILLSFPSHEKRTALSSFEPSALQEDGPLDLILRLVRETVLRHGGMMELKAGRTKKEMTISLEFPAERRKEISYPSVVEEERRNAAGPSPNTP